MMKKLKKRYVFGALLAIFLVFAIATNPTSADFAQYEDEKFNFKGDIGTSNQHVTIERKNFFLFSFYIPKAGPLEEVGIVHLGFAGKFFQVTEGQFDQPWWLSLVD